jgi:hypothetical protein
VIEKRDLKTVTQSRCIAPSYDKITVWVVHNTPNHRLLVEVENTRGEIDQQKIDEIVSAGGVLDCRPRVCRSRARKIATDAVW